MVVGSFGPRAPILSGCKRLRFAGLRSPSQTLVKTSPRPPANRQQTHCLCIVACPPTACVSSVPSTYVVPLLFSFFHRQPEISFQASRARWAQTFHVPQCERARSLCVEHRIFYSNFCRSKHATIVRNMRVRMGEGDTYSGECIGYSIVGCGYVRTKKLKMCFIWWRNQGKSYCARALVHEIFITT